MNRSMKIRLSIALAVILALSALAVSLFSTSSAADGNIFEGTLTGTIEKTEAVEKLMATSNHYIVVKMKQLGGSHYAYTEALAETNVGNDMYSEYNFDAGSQLVALSVLDNGDGTVSTYEKLLQNCTSGVVRDPSVSNDGTKVIFSMKKNGTDDFHIYELDLTDKDFPTVQLTFGSGRADTEPQYLPNGNIVFSSTRDVQTVDCWMTPVSNMFIMNGDGSNIRRVGYDQVHTTFPTVASDGRVLYTRWDYNDRTQMFIQGIFQMFQDGTYQTEVWGNGADYPTTLLHTRDIPGAPGKYISIASGHHVQQKGKVCIVDTTKGRNEPDSISMIFPDSTTAKRTSYDAFGQSGRSYKYPYAIDEDIFLVSAVENYSGKNAPYSIYLCDRTKSFEQSVVLVKGSEKLPAAQIVPLVIPDHYNRPSTVNYAKNTGTYYVANVYDGESMKGIEVGAAKYLRVVEIVYRSSAIGATYATGSSTGGTGDPFSPISTGDGSWDVKAVLGVVPVEEDGSVLFKAPSDTPIYFQLLDKDGCVIQTMRSWSTLMPNETASCVGCHENKNTTPPSGAKTTLALRKGVQELQPDLWMAEFHEYDGFDPYTDDAIGFSYPKTVQAIFDESCVVCHSDTQTSLNTVKYQGAGADASIEEMKYIIPYGALWQYSVDGGAFTDAYAPFGKSGAGQTDINTKWTSGKLTAKRSFVLTQFMKDAGLLSLKLSYSGSVTVKMNGSTVYTDTSSAKVERTVVLTDAQKQALALGVNSIEIEVSGGTNYLECALRGEIDDGSRTLVNKASAWSYVISANKNEVESGWEDPAFDVSSWKVGNAPFGDRNDIAKCNTSWTGSSNSIWLRQSFELTTEEFDKLRGGSLQMNIFYDDTVNVYINGTRVFNNNGWVDSYSLVELNVRPENVLQAGTNVIAVSLCNSGGGREIDLSLVACAGETSFETDAAFSLAGDPLVPGSNRMKRAFPLSYLFLTGSTPSNGSNQVGGTQFIGKPNGKYVKWNSSMTGAALLDPYTSGSFKSLLITKLREGHGGLSENQIRAIECWIDLCVPCFGSYDEGERFSAKELRVFEEAENKRAFYDTWDEYSKLDLGGILPEASLEVTFTPGATTKTGVSGSGKGYVILNYPNKYAAGDTLTVKVTGSKYVAISLCERQGEAIFYVPGGELTYTISSDVSSAFSAMMRSSGSAGYRYNTIFVRVPTEDELSRERNLAENTYDAASASGVFPHVTAASASPDAAYAARTAIDGFTSNGAAGSWPNQAWTPDAANDSFKLDFGREVVVNTLEIKLRAASGDTHPTSATLTFSDGSTQKLALCDTDGFLSFDLGGKTVTSLTIGGFDTAASGVFGVTEVRVFGTEAK